MSDDLLARLQAAKSAEERDWLVTEALLESLPPELRQAAWAAAVPHWFDAEILAGLLDKTPEEGGALYAGLQVLPFVEPFEARHGHNVHEVTRTAMLARLWGERREEYRTLSTRAAAYFSSGDEAETRIEEIYHLLIADPDTGADALYNQGWAWHDEPVFAYDLVCALSGAALEHAAAGRLDRQGTVTANLLSGRIDTLLGRAKGAKDKLEAARRASDPDSQLRADSDFHLGNVYGMLAEYPAARERYEEALPIYAAIGHRLGEASCIRALGDLHRMLAEYAEARERYEEALPIYAAIGDRVGEAGCIRALGDLHRMLAEYAEARERYEEARSIVAAIGDRLGEAHCIMGLGNVHGMLGEYTAARERCEEARHIYASIGDRVGEAICIMVLGDVAWAERNWAEAQRSFEAALDVYREVGSAHYAALALHRLGRVSELRGDRPAAARYYEETLKIFERIGVKDAEWVRDDLARVQGEEVE